MYRLRRPLLQRNNGTEQVSGLDVFMQAEAGGQYIEYYDDESGSPYWYNETTGEVVRIGTMKQRVNCRIPIHTTLRRPMLLLRPMGTVPQWVQCRCVLLLVAADRHNVRKQ